jgi:DNA-binding beta-propeller fold protein YncE
VSSGGSFVTPANLLVAANGDLFVADSDIAGGLGGVIRVNPATGAQMVVASGGFFTDPIGIAFDSNGNLVLADGFSGGTGAVIRVDPATGTQTVISAGGFFARPVGIAVVRHPATTVVVIDIKPGAEPNNINPKSKTKLAVAIMTTGTFDATTVDATTVRFGRTGIEKAPTQWTLQDADGDGDTDMLLRFSMQNTGIQCGDTSATLIGQTVSERQIQGTASLNTGGANEGYRTADSRPDGDGSEAEVWRVGYVCSRVTTTFPELSPNHQLVSAVSG